MRPFCDINTDAFLRSLEEEVGPERDGDPYAGEPPAAGSRNTRFMIRGLILSRPVPARYPASRVWKGPSLTSPSATALIPGAQAMALLTAASGVAHKGSRFPPSPTATGPSTRSYGRC